MEDSFQVIENYLMVRMPEEIDHHKSVYISKKADDYIMQSGVGNVVFDFEDTKFMDSSGIGIISDTDAQPIIINIKLLRLWSREVDMDTKRNTGKETKKMVKNEMDLRFDARSENEAFARVAVAGFVSVLNPTLEELSDIKTAVSEAVTNAIIHGYEIYGVEEEELLAEKITEGLAVMPQVFLHGRIEGDVLELLIRDEGCGIADIEQAMEPLYTTKPDLDRSGMGFSFMEAFMDDLEVESVLGQGTTVHMKKKLGTTSWIEQEE